MSPCLPIFGYWPASEGIDCAAERAAFVRDSWNDLALRFSAAGDCLTDAERLAGWQMSRDAGVLPAHVCTWGLLHALETVFEARRRDRAHDRLLLQNDEELEATQIRCEQAVTELEREQAAEHYQRAEALWDRAYEKAFSRLAREFGEHALADRILNDRAGLEGEAERPGTGADPLPPSLT